MESRKSRKAKHSAKGLNAWMISTIALSGLLIVSLLTGGFSNGVSSGVTSNAIATKAIDFINTYLVNGQTATLKTVNETGGLYLINFDLGGSNYDSYVTKDGSLLFPSGISLNEALDNGASQQAVDVPKNDKPIIELFVMSHCPYGVQIEKGIIPVVKTLDGKIDFQLKFVNYAMHGLTELNEELNQYCISKEYPSKLIPYLECFVKAGKTADCMTEVGLSDSSVSKCKNDTDALYKVTELYNDPTKAEWMGSYPPFNVYLDDNTKYSVQGSPTLVINGVEVSASRDAVSLLSAVCNAFSNAPSECSTDLSSYGSPAAGFGTETSASATNTANCG